MRGAGGAFSEASFLEGDAPMETLAREFNDLLLDKHEPPCLSLYQPTHRHHPDNQQDPIRFGNLVKDLEDLLQQGYPDHAHAALLRPFHDLAENREFWNRTLDGLAVLANANIFRVYRLQRPTPEKAIVADSFHLKPLIRILQSADRYQVLALTRRTVRLYEGNRDALDEAPLAENVPRTLEDALGDELTEPTLTGSTRGGSGRAIFHGHGSKKDQTDIDTERFFRAVDRAVWLMHSRPSGLPLILAALPEHHAIFRKVSRNPLLSDNTISANPESLDADALRRLGWEAELPQYLALTEELVDRFQSARPRGLASDNLKQVAAAAVKARVSTLLVDADRHVPGRVDLDSGSIDTGPAPDVDDLLDDLSELVLRRGGQTVVIPRERMPTQTGVAAIYRY